jgi:hypothetical protein
MIQGASGARLTFKSNGPPSLTRNILRQDLERNIAPEPRVARTVNLAHAPSADLRKNLIGPQFGAGRKRHSIRTSLAVPVVDGWLLVAVGQLDKLRPIAKWPSYRWIVVSQDLLSSIE